MAMVKFINGPGCAQAISRTHVLNDRGEDELVWPHSKDGMASVRSVYRLLRANDAVSNATKWRSVWSSKVLPKIKAFLWRLMSNALAVRQNLVNRGWDEYRSAMPLFVHKWIRRSTSYFDVNGRSRYGSRPFMPGPGRFYNEHDGGRMVQND